MNYCEACGMPMSKPEHYALGDTSGQFCLYCVNDDGSVKTCAEIFEGGVNFFMQHVDNDRAMAEKMTRKNMKNQSYWQDKDESVLQGEEATDEEFAEVMKKMMQSMLTAKASARPSQIDGIGLFADEDISKGTVIWKYNPRFDMAFEMDEVEKLPTLQQETIKKYAYLSILLGKYILPFDDSRFTNHSSKNYNMNIVRMADSPETAGVAARDIKKGEELLLNYRDIDQHDADSQEKYLDN